jgi:hypothetical protein
MLLHHHRNSVIIPIDDTSPCRTHNCWLCTDILPGHGSRIVNDVVTAYVCPVNTHSLEVTKNYGTYPMDCVPCPAFTNTRGRTGAVSHYDCTGHAAGHGMCSSPCLSAHACNVHVCWSTATMTCRFWQLCQLLGIMAHWNCGKPLTQTHTERACMPTRHAGITEDASVQRCPVGQWNGADTDWEPCKHCSYGRTTADDAAKQAALTDCIPKPGYGLQLDGRFNFSRADLEAAVTANNNDTSLSVAQFLATLPLEDCPVGTYSAPASWPGLEAPSALAQVCVPCPTGSTTTHTKGTSQAACSGVSAIQEEFTGSLALSSRRPTA